MAAKKGNNNGAKLKTEELKKEAYAQYCAHLAKGKSKKSWCFEHPNLTLTWESMERYIKEDEMVFDPLQKKVAEIKGYNKWEEIAELSAQGKNKANTASLQMVMRNKFGWDKETQIHHTVETEAQKLWERWENFEC